MASPFSRVPENAVREGAVAQARRSLAAVQGARPDIRQAAQVPSAAPGAPAACPRHRTIPSSRMPRASWSAGLTACLQKGVPVSRRVHSPRPAPSEIGLQDSAIAPRVRTAEPVGSAAAPVAAAWGQGAAPRIRRQRWEGRRPPWRAPPASSWTGGSWL